MPFANGVFTRLFNGTNNWQGDAAAGIKILAVKHDQHDKDIGDALSQTICNDGQSTIIADIPFNGKRITNLGMAAVPGQKDAVNVNYVQTLPGWDTSKYIKGADLDGRLNFIAPSGVNGITWTYADVSWVARRAEASKTQNRLVMNNTVVPNITGDAVNDVFVIGDTGIINNSGYLSNNLSFDGAVWRAIDPGFGTVMSYLNGTFAVASNDVATITNKYATATPRTFFSAKNASNGTFVTLDKGKSGDYARIIASMGSKNRWIMDLGDNVAETATERVGSDFGLYSYNNVGDTPFAEMTINRATHKVTFGGEIAATNLTTTDATMTLGPSTANSSFTMQRPINTGSFLIYGGLGVGAYLQLVGSTNATNANDIILGVTTSGYRYMYDYSAGIHYWRNNVPTINMTLNNAGDLTVLGQLNFDSVLQSSDTTCVLAAANGGAIYFQPNGSGVALNQWVINTAGDFTAQNGIQAATGGVYAGAGIRGKIGWLGAYGANYINLNWNGSVLSAYADGSIIGNLSYTASDYRIKKDIAPLASMWSAVKALKPIRYTQQAYDVWVNDDTPRLGFLAHELGESIAEGAVLGEKDGPDVQFVNPMAVIAVLTRALQEAMTRIEVLEAAA